ncbi:NAD-dependent epimerase/dehydratase [metagenome]|uniref:NAD-dependent epimerase/dehydratase n=1 Tax=metagenome TaxID=256318 RepID=A0A2P2C110_9ZZZZ
MQIVVAGASGFLGTHLTAALTQQGHQVTKLVRRPASGDGESTWDPYAGRLDDHVIEAADVVVNLAGAPTAGNPHSKKWARALEESRVVTTRLLAERIAAATTKPAFLAGNGVSYYGDHGADLLTEEGTSRGDALLTRVARSWQAATEPAAAAGARVCILRTSPVMDRRSAPLKQLALLSKLGLGTRLGDGRQYFPMISLRDWVGAVVHLVDRDDAAGPFNLCCPQTPTNREFTDALAHGVGRRALLVAPAFIIDKAAGDLASEVLGSVRAEPAALLAAGFVFRDEDVSEVLASGLRTVS